MKKVLPFFLILSTLISYTQETKEVKTKTETYSVLSNDKTIKHGNYKKLKKKTILEEGEYDNNKQVGVWNFYNSEGQLEQSFDYSLNKLLTKETGGQFDGNKISGTDTKPAIPPVMVGGKSSYFRFIQENLKYPKESKSKGIEGRQFVLATISENGEIIKTEVYRVLEADIDQEALRLISELPYTWIPAQHEGKNVEATVALPVLFRLK